jgi:hypothetical protein
VTENLGERHEVVLGVTCEAFADCEDVTGEEPSPKKLPTKRKK